MTGLIWKDILVIKKTILYMIVVILLMGGIYSFMDNESFVTFFVSIMMVSILISTMSYDEFYHWDRYTAILPMSRRKIVGCKYLSALVLFGGGMLFTAVLQAGAMALRGSFISLEEAGVLLVAPMVGLLGIAVVMPCYYRFGAQQSRIIVMALYGIPSVLLVLVLKLSPSTFQKVEEMDFHLGMFLLGLAVFVAAALAISFLVSVRIVEKKELK